MAAYYDFFRYIKLYSSDGTTLEATIEADSVTDSINFVRGNGVAWNTVDAGTDTFKFDVDYSFNVPLGTTALTLTDINNVSQAVNLVAGGNMTITRDNSGQVTIAALVGGVSKSISNITTANPPVITTTSDHSYTDGTEVTIVDVVGTTELNGNEYFMNVLTGNTFSLYSDSQLTTTIDGSAFTAYTSGGVATADYGGAKNAFKTIQVAGASPVVADNIQDILSLTGGTGIDITTTPATDSIAWAIDSTVTTLLGAQTLTNKTLTSPIIAAIKPSASNSWALPNSNDTFVGKATTDTLTNKSVDLANNTLTTTIAQLNTAVSDETVVARATTDTLTNKSIDLTTNTVTGTFAELNTAVSDETLVGLAATQTLTSKTLTDPILSPTATTGGKIEFLEGTNNGTNKATLIGPASTADVTVTLPAATDTLVGKATTDTFTNKSGSNSQWTNDEAYITAATTDTLTNKSIDLTTNTVTGTFAELNTAVSDATLVSIAGTETLTSKTLTDPILSPTATTGGKIEFLEGTNNGTNKATLIGPASTADVTITLPAATDTLVGKATTDTFTNKSGSNTQWTNDEAYITAATTNTLTNKSIDLTDNTVTGTLAEFNTAVSDETVVGRATTDTLTNKSISLTTNTVTGTIAELNTAVSDETVVGRATTDTLTNKTLSAPAFSGTATTFTSTGIDDNATGTRITVTDGSVGIGQSSLTSEPKLVVGAGGFKIQAGGHPGTYNTDELIIDFDASTGNGTARLWAIGDASAKGSYQFHVRDTAGSPADTIPLVITGGATDTVQVAAAADFVTPNISGSIKGMTFVMTIGDTTAIGDGSTTVTRYATPGNAWQANLALGTNMPVTSNMKCVAMSVLSDGVLTAGSSNATLMKNGADTTTTVTFANTDGGTGDVKQSTVNNNFDAGDRVGIKVVTLSATARSYFVMTQWELL